MASLPSKPVIPNSFRGINHLKLPAFSIQKTHDFYNKILPFKPLPQFDHFTPEHKVFAKMFLYEPTKLIIEVRHVPDQAVAQKGWDPVTYGVGTRQDLQEWADWLDANGARRSPIFTGIKSWVMACEDPDGRIVRLYVEDEEHEWTDQPDTDAFWLWRIRVYRSIALAFSIEELRWLRPVLFICDLPRFHVSVTSAN